MVWEVSVIKFTTREEKIMETIKIKYFTDQIN